MSLKETILQTAAAEIDEALHALVKAQQINKLNMESFAAGSVEWCRCVAVDEQIEEAISRLGV